MSTMPAQDSAARVFVDEVSLCFRHYKNRHPSLKESVIHWLRQGSTLEEPAEVWALRGVSVSFSSGERIGIVGRNGAGKSSLLRVISGIYRPTTGSVKRRGFLVPLLQVGLGFNHELTARENVIQAGAMLGISERQMRDRMDTILDFAELNDFADTPIKYYSTGMVTRLAFTTATEVSPEILVLDEVFSGGDMAFREKAMRRIEQLIERTQIVIMVSHSMNNITRLSTRAIWLDGGRILADGPPKDVVAEYSAAMLPPSGTAATPPNQNTA